MYMYKGTIPSIPVLTLRVVITGTAGTTLLPSFDAFASSCFAARLAVASMSEECYSFPDLLDVPW